MDQTQNPVASEADAQEEIQVLPGQNRNGVLIYRVPSERLQQAVETEALPEATAAEIKGGANLPPWLTYDGSTRTFTAIDPPPGVLPLPVVVKVPLDGGRQVNVPILLGQP